MDIFQICAESVKMGASDIHLSVHRPATLRVNGRLISIDEKPLTDKDTAEFVKALCSEAQMSQIERVGGVDFGFNLKEIRFRASCFRQKGTFGLVLRMLPTKFLKFEEIGLSEKVVSLLNRPRGLILVTGPTGSGKSTTLASMINFINENHDAHIITIEDPIEYYHAHKKSIVTQREVGTDVPSFSEAVIKALRQDPDVILIGELRDLSTMEAAITAAETGHLVFATLHTTGAARTVDRIIDVFPSHQQTQIRVQLSSTVIAVISQTLIPRQDTPGRIAAFEVMISTPAIANLIREGKTHQIPSELQTGAKHGSRNLDSHLLELYSKGIISYDDAIDKSYDPAYFAQQASQIGTGKATKPTLAKR